MRFSILVTAILISTRAVAAASGPECAAPKSTRNLLECALKRDPKVQRAKAELEQQSALPEQAGQRPNPELESTGQTGDSLGDRQIEIEASLAHTWELGGKRDARVGRAEAQAARAQAELRAAEDEVSVEIMAALYRARQIHDEIAVLQEAIETFRSVEKQFSKRPKLSPEQETELAVFQMAASELTIQRTALEQEHHGIEERLELAVGLGHDAIEPFLPPRRKKWPEISSIEDPVALKGSSVQLATADHGIALADREIENSLAWPDVKIGPILKYQADGPTQFMTYGLGVSLPLPLYNANGGGKAVALKGELKAETALRLTRDESLLGRKRLLVNYREAVNVLSSSDGHDVIEKKHSRLESLFFRGLISAPLVIEAHRQVLEYTIGRNGQELAAIEALWKLYAIDGTKQEDRQ